MGHIHPSANCEPTISPSCSMSLYNLVKTFPRVDPSSTGSPLVFFSLTSSAINFFQSSYVAPSCKGTLLFSPIPPVPLPSSLFLSLFLHPTDSHILPFHSHSFPFLSTSFPPTPFASEPRPVTPESSRASDSLGLARTCLYTSGLVRATSILFTHFITPRPYFPRSLVRLLYIPLHFIITCLPCTL